MKGLIISICRFPYSREYDPLPYYEEFRNEQQVIRNELMKNIYSSSEYCFFIVVTKQCFKFNKVCLRLNRRVDVEPYPIRFHASKLLQIQNL